MNQDNGQAINIEDNPEWQQKPSIDARLRAFIQAVAQGNSEYDRLSEEAGTLIADWDKHIESRALDSRELATVLHGLRMIQCEGRIEGCNAADCEHFEDVEPLDNEEIDELCERLNFSDVAAKPPASPASSTTAAELWDAIKAFRIAADGDSNDEEHDAAVTLADEAASYLESTSTKPAFSFTLPADSTPPSDPEEMNDQRSNAALAAVTYFAINHGEAIDEESILEQNIVDLLGDLMHLCDRTSIGFDYCVEKAGEHYDAEIGAE